MEDGFRKKKERLKHSRAWLLVSRHFVTRMDAGELETRRFKLKQSSAASYVVEDKTTREMGMFGGVPFEGRPGTK